jgi:hypothetical protein
MSDCKFCRYLTDMIAFDRIRENGNPVLHHDYHVLILQRAWNDFLGTAHAGEMTHRPMAVGFPIRFCPECGKELNIGAEAEQNRQPEGDGIRAEGGKV